MSSARRKARARRFRRDGLASAARVSVRDRVRARCTARVLMAAAVLSMLAALGAAARAAEQPASIWDGVYTSEQAQRGAQLYAGPCGRCHGVRLDGAPDDPDMFPTRPIAGPKFLRDWNGRSVETLLEYVRNAMPENNPGFLSDREYADLVAYMLDVSGAPAGGSELPTEPSQLAEIEITPR